MAQDVSLIAQWLLATSASPLIKAAKYQLWGVCEKLLGSYQPTGEELHYVLKQCARQGQPRIVSSLLQWCCSKACAGPCAKCWYESDALIQAASNGHLAVCTLLACHPGVSAQTVRFSACQAAKQGHLDVLHLLLTSRPDASSPHLQDSPMCEAAQAGKVEAMQLLVQHGASVHNAWDTPWSSRQELKSPLCLAAEMGHVEVVRWLLSQGMADTDIGISLECSAGCGHKGVVQALMECLTDVSTYGSSALAAAVNNGHLEVALLLFEACTPTERSVVQQASHLLALHLMNNGLMQGPAPAHVIHDTVMTCVRAFTSYCHLDFAEVAVGAVDLLRDWFQEPSLFLAQAKGLWNCVVPPAPEQASGLAG
jgi:hypothetical protein